MSYSNGLLSDQSYQTANKYVQRGLPGVGFKLTDTGDYDMQNKKLTNVKSGTDSNDAVNKSQLDATTNLLHGSRAGDVVNDKAVIYSNAGAVHANSLYIEDPPDQGNSNEVRIMTEHQSYPNIHLNIPDLHNFDGHGGRPKSELMVTSVEQTVTGKKVFENIEVHDPTSNNQAANKSYADTKLSLTGGTMTGDLILPHHNYPIPGNTNKVINYESQREIFLSRQESFPMQADINMNNNFIQNIATPTSSHQVTNKGYCDYNFLNRQKGGVLMGPLSMNRNDLTGIPDTPKFGYSAVNKNYVDGEITKIDTTQFVKKVGDTMTGVLNMNGNKIKNVGTPYTYENDAAVNVGFFNTELNASNSSVFTQITNAYKQYVDEELLKSHLVSSHIENAFKYLLDQDESSSERKIVNGIQDFNGSPHKNKKAYDIDLIYTSGTQNYDSKIGINLYPLPIGKFTIIMEYYFPEDINISLLAEASTAIINKQTITNFPSYKKQLVQINQQTKDTPDYLIFTIRGSGTTATNPEGYLVFYGVKEWVDSVPPKIYDHALETGMFEYDGGKMKMNTILDMNSNIIKNLADGIESDDAINKNQFDKLKKQFDPALNEINELKINTPNYIHMKLFTYGFYDLTNINTYKFNYIGSTTFISGIQPNIIFDAANLSIPNSFLENGILFPSRTNIVMRLGQTINESVPYTIMLIATLKNTIYVNFIGTNNILTAPMFAVDNDNLDLKIFLDPSTPINTKFPIEFKSKQVMIMIHHKPVSNTDNGIYSISLAGYNANIKTYTTAPTNHTADRLRIMADGNIINKICYQNKNITFDDRTDYSKLLVDEKKNGTFIKRFF